MKKIPFLFFLATLSFTCLAQTTRYYRDQACTEEVESAKGKYSKTITEGNGTVTTTIKDLKKDQVRFSDTWKGEEPYGIWVGLTGRGPEELDYNFDLVYGDKDCVPANIYNGINLTDYFQNNEALNYTAPKLDVKEATLMSFVSHNLRYPAHARRNGIQGKVELTFTITKEGNVHDVVVAKGIHLHLDKEAVRVIRKLKFSSPPLLNGQPKEVCVKIPLMFRLG